MILYSFSTRDSDFGVNGHDSVHNFGIQDISD